MLITGIYMIIGLFNSANLPLSGQLVKISGIPSSYTISKTNINIELEGITFMLPISEQDKKHHEIIKLIKSRANVSILYWAEQLNLGRYQILNFSFEGDRLLDYPEAISNFKRSSLISGGAALLMFFISLYLIIKASKKIKGVGDT
jgi:hypothetical protein